MSRFHRLFKAGRNVIGMIHVKALPGTPKSCFSVQELVDHVCEEALIYRNCGVDGVIVENMHDVPYVMGAHVGPEVTSVMTRICSEVKKILGAMPCGVQILSGNNFSATAVALAAGFQFVRAESFVFGHIGDEGFMQACAGPLLRYATNVGASDILFFTDIKKKHSSHAITSDVSLSETAKAAEFFLSDGIILTGMATGDPPRDGDLKEVKSATSLPIIVGSGATEKNVMQFSDVDAFIVGSHFKVNGHWSGDLSADKISAFVEKVKYL